MKLIKKEIKKVGELMENLEIKNVDLSNDIKAAQNIIRGKLAVNRSIFNEHSSIYRISNETISNENYFENLKGKKRVLSITASGDQIINSILCGTKSLIGMDISTFPKYYFALKLAALKELNEDEYLDFIVGRNRNNMLPLSIDLYSKVRESLQPEIMSFWDSILFSYNSEMIQKSPLFGTFIVSQNKMIKNNPYLQDDNYTKVKNAINDVKIELIDYNMFKVNNLKIGKFDLINLSSLINYINPPTLFQKNKAEKYKKYVKTLPLTNNGIALTYNFTFDGDLALYFFEDEFEVYNIKEDIFPYNINNELIIYKKLDRSKK